MPLGEDQLGVLDVAAQIELVGALLGHRDPHAFPVDVGDRVDRRAGGDQVGRGNLEVGRGERDLGGALRLGAEKRHVPDAGADRVTERAGASRTWMNSTGTPSRRASSRARSGATPRGSVAEEPGVTSRKLPWLSPTRSLPLGASSDRTAGVISVAMAPDVSTNRPIAGYAESAHAAGYSPPRSQP